MTNSDTLLKAALNRLKARLEEKIIESAADIAVAVREAPEKFKKEWDLLKEEIYQEAEKIQNETNQKEQSPNNFTSKSDFLKPIDKIDIIRAKVSELTKKIETKQT